jgi:hypothetical protein
VTASCEGGSWNNYQSVDINIDRLDYEACKGIWAATQCMFCSSVRSNCGWNLPFGYCKAFTGYYGY